MVGLELGISFMSRAALIGRIAVKNEIITPEQLEFAVEEQTRNPGIRLGEVLVDLGYIDEGQLGMLLAMQARESDTRGRRDTPVPDMKAVPEGVALGAIALKRVAASQAADVEIDPEEEEERRRLAEARGWLLGLLSDANVTGASDVLILPNQPVRLRRFGRLHDFTTGPVSAAGTESLLMQTLDDEQAAELLREGQITLSFQTPSVGRFRLQLHRELDGLGGTFHRAQLGDVPPAFDDLGLPTWVSAIANFAHGLILIAGPMGSGRSTTMGALANVVAEEGADHVVMIENPREHRPAGGDACITQLEVGVHCTSVRDAILDAPRMDANIICIDELPTDAVDAALRAADADHVVIATMRSPSSARAIEMLLDAYPNDERRQAGSLIADSVRAVMSQRLVPMVNREGTEEIGVTLALEIIHVDEHIRELIRTDQLDKISAYILTGNADGSSLLDTSLTELVRSGRITLDTARANARNPANFVPRDR